MIVHLGFPFSMHLCKRVEGINKQQVVININGLTDSQLPSVVELHARCNRACSCFTKEKHFSRDN
ncbi:MAG: hypothetical protein IJX25_03760 [Clostridia bacterium]|nr:hypothetical protein [Clostridia bacterium]MBQ8792335.1 hypothetical protein [Clostridia bacterium]